MANIVSIPPVSPHLEQKQKLVYNDALDTSSIQNILLISRKVVESQQFFDSASSNTFPIIYSQNSAKIELLELLRNKFQNGVKRIAFAFHDPLNGNETFLNNKSFFEENDLIENQTTFSENVSFLTDLITEFKVEHCDFLACNSLQYSNWKKYYELLNKMTNVISGASNDNTGNIQYGADWVMENTNENVKDIYFTSSIDNYTSSLVVFTVGDLNYSTSGSSATVTGASTSTPLNWNLTIPSTVTNNSITYNVTSIGGSAFSNKNNLVSVIIPNSVTSILYWAFYNCTSLSSVTIGSGVQTIGSSAFYGCTGLTSVTIPNSVISIDNDAFRSCSHLSSFTIGSGLATLNGNDIFVDDASLSTFIVDANNTKFSSFEGVLFNYDKSKLVYYPPGKIGTSYTFPTSVTNINNQAFLKCVGLTTITIPNIVTVVGWNAFQGCTGLTSVTIGTGFTSISDSMFNGCTGLTTVTIPSNVTSIGGYAFASCSGLTSINIPNSVTTLGSNAFENCSGLTSVIIGSGVTSIDASVFQGCTGLTSIIIGSGVTSIGGNSFQNFINLTSVTIGSGVQTIGDSAFNGCTGLTSITIPNSVTNIDNNAFRSCSQLSSFTIGSGLTTLNGNDIFVDDASLSTFIVDASNANFSSFEGVLFNNDKTKLVYYPPGKIGTSYTFPTSVTNINNQAFFKCINLTTITIPNIVTEVGWNAFQGCTGLTSVTIGTGFTSISSSMFNGCSGLTTVTIPSTVTSIDGYAFASCSGLTSVTIGSNVTSIGDNAFERCSALTSVIIPDKVTTIGTTAFWLCTGLTSVTIGSGVTYINFGAFSNCDALTTVYFMGNIPVINNSLNFTTNTSDTAYVLTSATLLDTNAVAGTTVTDYLSPTFFTNVLIQSSFPSSDICFRKGTPVRTDQGLIHIDKISPAVHTIRNKKIVAISKTVTQEKYLVCFEKDCLGPNMPSQKTFISANHKIFNKGTMIKAKEFVGKYENIYKVKYSGEVLYNVLMEEYDRIVVNNLICESLHPENTIAQLYTILQGFNLEEQQEIIKQYNEFTLKNKICGSTSSKR